MPANPFRHRVAAVATVTVATVAVDRLSLAIIDHKVLPVDFPVDHFPRLGHIHDLLGHMHDFLHDPSDLPALLAGVLEHLCGLAIHRVTHESSGL